MQGLSLSVVRVPLRHSGRNRLVPEMRRCEAPIAANNALLPRFATNKRRSSSPRCEIRIVRRFLGRGLGWGILWLLLGCCLPVSGNAGLPDTIERVKPSIVGIGTLQHQRRQRVQVRGSGFVVGDGKTVITNAHVVPRKLNSEQGEFVAVFFRQGKGTGSRRATEIARDEAHDISVLRIRGAPMPALKLLPGRRVREGDLIAFTGFPIGAVLGLYPATHRGIVSALTPFAIPVHGSKKLTLAQRKKLARPFEIYQLDAVAYPGNSGSPVYDVTNGGVLAVINSVFVKKSREDVISDPSGISYAIPIRHVQRLLDQIRAKRAKRADGN